MKTGSEDKYGHTSKRDQEMEGSDSDSDSEPDNELYQLAMNASNQAKLELESQIESHEKSSENMGNMFFLDKNASGSGTSKDDVDSESDSEDEEGKSHRNDRVALSSSLEVGMDVGELYVNTNAYKNPQASIHCLAASHSQKDQQLAGKSVLTPDFESKHEVGPYSLGFRKMKKQRKTERQQTKGKGWYGMKLQEMTDEKKNDLTLLQWRRALDPKHFMKAPDIRALPKFFQMGKVVEGPEDFYSARIPKKQRKANLVEELLADAEFRKKNKQKYVDAVEAKKRGRGAFKHMKRLKKRKK